MSLLSVPRLSRRSALAMGCVVLMAVVVTPVSSQLARTMPDSLTDREFWQFFTTMSEAGGTFPSENFISNEQTYQHVIPTLKRSLTPGGVYLGVGPEQNFTYIANLKPRLAVIFDIRRQNAMAHLMYKALFELSPTRADFVSRLFSRPLARSLAFTSEAGELFAAAMAASPSDSAFEANRRAIFERLTNTHGFELTQEDRTSITHVYAAFFEAGPNINYGYRPGMQATFRPGYPTYGQLQTLTNADGGNMAFLATEENYQSLRALHRKNLIVPVVGDFAGPKAIRGVGDYLRQRGGTVTAFYLSNVEQYLYRQFGDAERFYQNVHMLPVDSTSAFIRSVPPRDGGFGPVMTINQTGVTGTNTNYYSVRVVDSAGMSIIFTSIIDSAGKTVNTRTVDSTGARKANPVELFRALRARDDSVLRARADSARRASALNLPAPGAGFRRDTTPSRIVFMRDSAIVRRDTTPAVPAWGTIFRRDTMPPVAAWGMVSVGGGTLVSGIASISVMLDAFDKGRLRSYPDAIAMTKTNGWK